MHRRLGALLAAAIFAVAAVAASGSLPDAVADHVDAFVLGRMQAWDTPGMSLVIVRHGEVVVSRGYGYADREAFRPMTEETLLMLGSTAKALTALAVMQLVERGAIELDAPVTRYVPWFSTPGGREHDITVRHLLSHSSGYPWGILFTGRCYPAEIEDYVRWLASVRLEAAPGTRFGYSNDTFVVLGLIIEQVTDTAYEAYMHEHVLGPLRMTRTTFDVEVAEARGLALGYRNQAGRVVPFDSTCHRSERPAGKLMTSAAELANYFMMLLDGGHFEGRDLITAGSLEQMWTPVVPVADTGEWYGLAWYLGDIGGMRLLSHPGSVQNSGSRFILVPEASLAVGVMSNISRPLDPRHEVSESVTVATLLFGEDAIEAPASRVSSTVERDDDVRDAIVGEYSSAAGPVRIVRDRDALVGTVYGHRFELQAVGDATFLVRSEFDRLDGLELEFQAADPSVGAWLRGSDRLALLGRWFAFRSE
jgi:CubicO group peptidase (beta-lactamase class C family)